MVSIVMLTARAGGGRNPLILPEILPAFVADLAERGDLVGGAPDELALVDERKRLEGVGEGEPGDAVVFAVVAGDVAAGGAHEVETDGLPAAGALGAQIEPVLDQAELGDNLGGIAGLLG